MSIESVSEFTEVTNKIYVFGGKIPSKIASVSLWSKSLKLALATYSQRIHSLLRIS
jgi:hypothetical protein